MSEKHGDDIMQQYGSTEVRFTSYYKYAFTFQGIAADGSKVTAIRDSRDGVDGIYKFEVTALPVRLDSIYPDAVYITKPDGTAIHYDND